MMLRTPPEPTAAISLVVLFGIVAGCGSPPPRAAATSTASTVTVAEPQHDAGVSTIDSAVVDSLPIGEHENPHTVMVVCSAEEWCEQEVTDRLSIRASGARDLEVAIELVQANAHLCAFEGVLRRVSDHRWEHASAPAAPPCQLALEWSGVHLVISSTGCREYCGARATLAARFPYDPFGPSAKPID